jgi:DDE superfamily endonuclease
VFFASCVNTAAASEIRWPTVAERAELATRIPELPGCSFIDGTLVRIRRPYNDPLHSNWCNGRKKIYCFNNTVIIDHNGLFIYVEMGYPRKFHDVNILRHSTLYREWRDYFVHDDDYFEYLLGDPGYIGEEMFIMRRVGRREVPDESDMGAIDLYNRMHAGYRVRVEWGIGGLKRKWKRFMKRFDSTKPKFPHLFQAGCIMTNVLHRRRMEMNFEVMGNQSQAEQDIGWEGDFYSIALHSKTLNYPRILNELPCLCLKLFFINNAEIPQLLQVGELDPQHLGFHVRLSAF